MFIQQKEKNLDFKIKTIHTKTTRTEVALSSHDSAKDVAFLFYQSNILKLKSERVPKVHLDSKKLQ